MNLKETEISRLLRLVQAEYQAMPGLNLTRQQFQRLWGLDNPTCETLLNTLLTNRFLTCTTRGLYVWTGADSLKRPTALFDHLLIGA